MTIVSMASLSKKCPFIDDDDDQGPSSTQAPPPKWRKVGDNYYDNDGNDDDNESDDYDSDDDSDGTSDVSDDSEPESGDDEPFPLDFEDRKLLERRARPDDGDTSSESMESVDYHTVDDSDDDDSGSNNDSSDDDTVGEFSDEEDW
jgi:hypothetical protein